MDSKIIFRIDLKDKKKVEQILKNQNKSLSKELRKYIKSLIKLYDKA